MWNFAPNLVHVKPYHFFKHTGDINAPPGLSKHDNDGGKHKPGAGFTYTPKQKRVQALRGKSISSRRKMQNLHHRVRVKLMKRTLMLMIKRQKLKKTVKSQMGRNLLSKEFVMTWT